jgi:glyoxylase-like metal-dependent hydrolase (beta-lactamase superfamily II)
VLQEATGDRASAIYAFPPNRDTLGGTAYLLMESTNILIDCPAWDAQTQAFLTTQGGVQWLFLTHRDSIGKAKAVQKAFGCAIVIQEQEAYLLPDATVTSFQQDFTLSDHTRALWTSGHTPGSACLYHAGFGGVLFTGRHVLPTPQGQLAPIKTAKTFHWHRQQRNVQKLVEGFTPETLHWICPGANLGFLRGKLALAEGYQQLQQWQVHTSA